MADNTEKKPSIAPKMKNLTNPYALLAMIITLLAGFAGHDVVVTFGGGGGSANTEASSSKTDLNIQKIEMANYKEVQAKQDTRIEKIEKLQNDQTVAITQIYEKLSNQNEKLTDIKRTVDNIQRVQMRDRP
jgi:TolA-binding protein